jgi:hypothetical protein
LLRAPPVLQGKVPEGDLRTLTGVFTPQKGIQESGRPQRSLERSS